jgi:hypothetical protein
MAKKEYKARTKYCTFAHIFIGKESVKNGELTTKGGLLKRSKGQDRQNGPKPRKIGITATTDIRRKSQIW